MTRPAWFHRRESNTVVLTKPLWFVYVLLSRVMGSINSSIPQSQVPPRYMGTDNNRRGSRGGIDQPPPCAGPINY